ncbi:type II CAAX endopeptidase family protein [Bacillus sp. OAE603]|uniref:CPBP family intramembrane glutamic endopeptidase n=1 Tax=Gottfriedia sp. OAE603 TaxID=2663872 RepID=UPI00178A9F1C
MNNDLHYNTFIPENIPNERKTAIKTLVYYILIFVIGLNVLLFLGSIGAAIVVAATGLDISDDELFKLFTDASIYLDTIFGFLSLWWLYYYTKKNGILSLRRIKISVYDILLIIGAYVALIVTAGLLDFIFKSFGVSIATPDNQKAVEDLLSSNPVLMMISAIILAPIKEEWITRKLIIGSIFKNLPYVGLIVSSFGFGLLHMIAGFSFYALIQYSLAGLIFGILYILTKRIEVSILAHFLNNFVSILAFYLLK